MLGKTFRGVCSVIGCFLLFLICGAFYLWGTIDIYVRSYYKNKFNPELTDRAALSLFPIMAVSIQIGILFGVKITDYVGLRLASFVFCSFLSASVFISSMVESFWIFMAFYSIIFGVCSGLCSLPPLFNCYKFFPRHRGLIGGLVYSGYSLGIFIPSILAQYMINPDNIQPEKLPDGSKCFQPDIANNVPRFLRYLSLYFLIVSIFGVLLSFPATDKDMEKSYKNADSEKSGEDDRESGNSLTISSKISNNYINNDSETKSRDSDEKDKNREEIEQRIPLLNRPSEIKLTPFQAIKTKKFLMIFSMTFCSSAYFYCICSNFKNYGIIRILDDNFLTLCGSIGGLIACFFKLVWGKVLDLTSFRAVYSVVLFLELLSLIILRFVAEYKAVYFIIISVGYIVNGAHFVIFPALITEIFGINIASKIYGVSYYAYVVANLFQFAMVYFLRDIIGFDQVFYIFLVMIIISCLILFKFDPRPINQ